MAAHLYRDLADLYDRIYADKVDYVGNAAQLIDVLAALGVGEGTRVLEAACGTGNYLEQLAPHYAVAGFDLSGPMLEVARRKLPGVPLDRADMRDFAVDEPYDALVCLFSSVGHLITAQDRREAAACFADAVRPGGALVVEPFVGPRAFRPGMVGLDTARDDEVTCARLGRLRPDGDEADAVFSWLVSRGGGPIRHFEEVHRLAFVDPEVWVEVFDEAGFDCRFDPEGFLADRGLVIGTRR